MKHLRVDVRLVGLNNLPPECNLIQVIAAIHDIKFCIYDLYSFIADEENRLDGGNNKYLEDAVESLDNYIKTYKLNK